MLRVGALFAVVLFGCQVQGFGHSAAGPSSPPPPAASASPDPESASSSEPAARAAPDSPMATSSGSFKMPDISKIDSVDVAKKMMHDAGLVGDIVVDYQGRFDHSQQLPCATEPAAGQIVPHEFEAHIVMCLRGHDLVGMTVDAAKADVARIHDALHMHDIRIDIADGTCAHGTVCAVTPADWNVSYPDESMTLTVGK